MHPIIALDEFQDEFQDEWPWPTFDLLFQVAMQNLVPAPIYTQFEPWMSSNMKWPWPTFDLLFQIAMNGNCASSDML